MAELGWYFDDLLDVFSDIFKVPIHPLKIPTHAKVYDVVKWLRNFFLCQSSFVYALLHF